MAIELTPAFLDRLRGLAQNCEQPIWELNEHDDVVSVADTVAVCGFYEDAQFIAEANPATVLAMVEEIELLKKRLRWFPAHVKEKIDMAILAHTGGMADPRKELCRCDHTVGYYCEYCAVYDALISCKQATESEAGQ